MGADSCWLKGLRGDFNEPRIHEADIADVFAAFDVDRDDIISEQDMASFIKHEGQADPEVL